VISGRSCSEIGTWAINNKSWSMISIRGNIRVVRPNSWRLESTYCILRSRHSQICRCKEFGNIVRTNSLSRRSDFSAKRKLLVQNTVLTICTQQYLNAAFCASCVVQMRETKPCFLWHNLKPWCTYGIRDCPKLA
jgi:hypothetical protein